MSLLNHESKRHRKDKKNSRLKKKPGVYRNSTGNCFQSSPAANSKFTGSEHFPYRKNISK